VKMKSISREGIEFGGTAGVTETNWYVAPRRMTVRQISGLPEGFTLCVRTNSGTYRELKVGSQLKLNAVVILVQKQPDYTVKVVFGD
jgi:hypothetical protein